MRRSPTHSEIRSPRSEAEMHYFQQDKEGAGRMCVLKSNFGPETANNLAWEIDR